MQTPVTVAPSILAADFTRLGQELAQIEHSGADWVHLDVMDGHFVPNLTFGPPIIKQLRGLTSLPFDVHLMIETPELWLEQYRQAGADRITFHLEACRHSQRYLTRIRELGAASGISLNPQTPICGLEYLLDVCDQVLIMTVNPGFGGQSTIEPVIDKITQLQDLIRKLGVSTHIEVDGGIGPTNAQRILASGADILVMGSAFFQAPDKRQLVSQIKKMRV